MKIVVFGDAMRVGAWDGENIVDLNRAYAGFLQRQGDSRPQETADARVPARLEALIAAGEPALDAAQRAVEHASAVGPASGVDGETAVYAASQVRLHAPWASRRIACVGGNYADHLRGMEANRPGNEGATIEQITRRTREAGQWGFWKVPVEVAGPEDEIPFPKRGKYFDYEGEGAIVIGKRGKDIPASRLEEHVWGMSLVNDWSIRDGAGPARIMSYNLPKNFDRSTSMGPCIVVGELDAGNVDVETRVNGALRQQYNTKAMIFSFAEVLAELSRDFTFVPGDVISGGTAAGTAADKTKPGPDGARPLDLFLKVGDVVEVSSPQVGTLRNRIV